MAPRDALATVRCPTCRAVQDWSDTCRRCKSDLSLLRDCAEAYRRARRACLDSLRRGEPRAALRAARECESLRPDVESRRLLALAALLGGDWPTAAAMAEGISPVAAKTAPKCDSFHAGSGHANQVPRTPDEDRP
jgi:hypothetical protein